MENRYLNEAIIGNKNILAMLSSNGELLRLYSPDRDYRQYINFFHTGIKVNDSDLIYLHDDINNTYRQYYDTDTNILNTEIVNSYFELTVLQTDFAPINQDVLIRKYEFINNSSIDLDVNFLIHSDLLSHENNFISGKAINDGIMQYSHDFAFCTIAKNAKKLSYQINGSKENIKSGVIGGKDYEGLSHDSSVSYEVGVIKSGEKKVIEIYITILENTKGMQNIESKLKEIKKIDAQKEYSKTKSYWRRYVKKHNGLDFKESKNAYEEKIYEIYIRTILLFPLLFNQSTGGIIAAPGMDEKLTQSGGYAYCWPRDAVFVTRAFDILKMTKESDKFYQSFCKNTQSKNGMWEQRFYTNESLAPTWGYQIDETASVIYGIYMHYEYTKDEKFLKNNLRMCEKAIEFLKKYIIENLNIKDLDDDVVKKEIENSSYANKTKLGVGYDIWETFEGLDLYSLSSIYAAFDSMQKIYKALGENVSEFEGNRLREEKIAKSIDIMEKLQVEIKNYIKNNLYDSEKQSFVNNAKDKQVDISILGTTYPFNVFAPKERKVKNTIDKMNLTLRTFTGGYRRFETDNYRGGNPWPLANLWMTLYYLQAGEKIKAKETFDFVLKTANKHNFLAEQVDNNILKPNWVIGLGWTHAMFILVLEKTMKNK